MSEVTETIVPTRLDPSSEVSSKSTRVRSMPVSDTEPGHDAQRTKRVRLSRETECESSTSKSLVENNENEEDKNRILETVKMVQTKAPKQSESGTEAALETSKSNDEHKTSLGPPLAKDNKLESSSIENDTPQTTGLPHSESLSDSSISDSAYASGSSQNIGPHSMSTPECRSYSESSQSKPQDYPESLEELIKHLDFSPYCTSNPKGGHDEIQFRLSELARRLLNQHYLVIRAPKKQRGFTISKFFPFGGDRAKDGEVHEEVYELLEVECYLRATGHMDPYAHATHEQSISGRWYFHRTCQRSPVELSSTTGLTISGPKTKAAGYRGGTRKGLDLTFGAPVLLSSSTQLNSTVDNQDSDAPTPRGGVLIRSIRRVSDEAVISGPSLIVDEILRVCNSKSVAELVKEKLGGNLNSLIPSNSMHSIFLRYRPPESRQRLIVYHSPRVGLDLSQVHEASTPVNPRVTFVQKHYRFFVRPKLLTANGRPQTFLGVYKLLTESEIITDSAVRKEVAELTGISDRCVQKYADWYNNGLKNESVKLTDFYGPPGKGVSSSPELYLRMMGTLERAS